MPSLRMNHLLCFDLYLPPSLVSQPSLSGLKNVSARFPSPSGILNSSFRTFSNRSCFNSRSKKRKLREKLALQKSALQCPPRNVLRERGGSQNTLKGREPGNEASEGVHREYTVNSNSVRRDLCLQEHNCMRVHTC